MKVMGEINHGAVEKEVRPRPTVSSPNSLDLETPILIVATLVVYALMQWLAFALLIRSESVSVFWPPAGVMFAALVIANGRQWRLLVPLLFFVTYAANWIAGRDVTLNLAFSFFDVLVGAVGAWFYRQFCGRILPHSSLSALAWFFVSAGLSSIASASLGVFALIQIAGFEIHPGLVWGIWCGAMLTGMLLVAPAFMTLTDAFNDVARAPISSDFLTIVPIAVLLLFFAHGDIGAQHSFRFAATLLLVPLLIWTAVRCRPFEALVLQFAVSTVEIFSMVHSAGWSDLLAPPISQYMIWIEAILVIRTSTVLLMTVNSFQLRKVGAESRVQAEKLSNIIDTATDGIISIDQNGIVQSFSQAAERHFGYPADEVIGQNIKVLMPEYYRERHDGYLERYRSTGDRRIIGIGRIVSGQRKDGTIFPMELSVGEARVGQQRVFTGFVRDISERQKTEQRLHEIQEELFHVARLNAMGELASALAHELNQPLTAIKNYAQAGSIMIKKEGGQKELPGILEKTIEQAGRAGDIIKKLRALVTTKKIAAEFHDIHQIIEEASALALIGGKEDGIKTTIVRNRMIPPVLVDRIQIQQILINLIRNALDAMRGYARRDLIIEPRERNGSVEVRVCDTGPGILPDIAANLFKPFMTTKDTGMGVGLSISRSIAQAHGGELTYEPNPAGGAVFVLTLPLPAEANTVLQ